MSPRCFPASSNCCRCCAASASAENPARVINIGSVAGISAMGEQAYAYGPSKAALHQLSRMLAKELVGEHINVNVIAPGRFPEPHDPSHRQ